jgi:hypothetical protein
MEEKPETITVCELECMVLPNGEILCKGKTIGYFEEYKEYLKIKE